MRDSTLGEEMARCVWRRLKRYKGNKTHTARSLGVSLRALRSYLKPQDNNGDRMESFHREMKRLYLSDKLNNATIQSQSPQVIQRRVDDELSKELKTLSAPRPARRGPYLRKRPMKLAK